MSLPRFLVPPGDLDSSSVGSGFTLEGDEGRHAAAVRRIRAGELLDIADGAGVVARCTVVSAGRDRLELKVDGVTRVAPSTPKLVLVQALAKGGRDELAVETATEVGVDAVVPWQADRSVVRWSGDRGAKALAKWQAVAREASKQSRRAYVPFVEPLQTSASLPTRLATSALAVVMHESAKRSLLDVPLPAAGSVLVVVGPEGGISEAEVTAFEAAGGVPVRLGPEVLRASTAGPIALGWLAAKTGRWA